MIKRCGNMELASENNLYRPRTFQPGELFKLNFPFNLTLRASRKYQRAASILVHHHT